MNEVPFSVAISVYKNDNPVFFDKALESITIAQSIKPDEIVLIVDGPVSHEIDLIIQKYEGISNLRVERLSENKGLGNALKLAVEKASYDIVARMDSDDISYPTRFEEQLRFLMEHPNVDVIGGNINEFVDKENNIVAKRVVPNADKDIKNYMKNRCAMNHVSVMYKKAAVLSAGGYLDCYCNEDYYLWVRMMLNGAVFANTGTDLVNVRTGYEMYGRRGGKKYFASERFIQQYMFKNKIISWCTYSVNILKRAIVELMMPNSIRGWIFRHFARKH